MSDPTTTPLPGWKPLILGDLDDNGNLPGDDATRDPDHGFKPFYDADAEGNTASQFVPLYALADLDENDMKDRTKNAQASKPNEETLRQLAFEEGLVKGEEKGYQDGLQKAEPVVRQIQELLAELEGLWQHMVRSHETQIINLVGRVAEKVTLAQVTLDKDTVRRSIQQALDTMPEAMQVTIEINPKEVNYIETLKPDFFDRLKSLKHISVIPNSSVSPGGCRIKTDTGEVDAGIEARLSAVCQSIIDANKGKTADVG